LLEEWNATELELPKASRIDELIEQRAQETAEDPALICRDRQLSYSELNARANQLASRLRNLGVEAETLVGICVERSLEMVVGLLAIVKSGGAYVPLDPAYPKERLAFMLEDSKPLVVLTQTPLLDALPKTTAHMLCVDKLGFESSSDCSSQHKEAQNSKKEQHEANERSAGRPGPQQPRSEKGCEIFSRRWHNWARCGLGRPALRSLAGPD